MPGTAEPISYNGELVYVYTFHLSLLFLRLQTVAYEKYINTETIEFTFKCK